MLLNSAEKSVQKSIHKKDHKHTNLIVKWDSAVLGQTNLTYVYFVNKKK